MPSEGDIELFKLKSEICKTFSDPKRLMIINELRDGEKQVGELATALKTPQAVISRQLALLRTKGIVKPRRDGTNVYYSLTDSRIIEACDIVHDVLVSRLQENRELTDKLIKQLHPNGAPEASPPPVIARPGRPLRSNLKS